MKYQKLLSQLSKIFSKENQLSLIYCIKVYILITVVFDIVTIYYLYQSTNVIIVQLNTIIMLVLYLIYSSLERDAVFFLEEYEKDKRIKKEAEKIRKWK